MAKPDCLETVIKKLQITPLKLKDLGKEKKIKDILSCFELSEEKISTLSNLFSDLIKKGLHYNGTSPFSMQNTFVFHGLEGNENGTFLALDLGGTNFRIILVELLNGKIIREDVKKYDVPNQLRVGSGVDLFQFLANSLADFSSKHGIIGEKIPLGFTFSFPTEQNAIDSACLQQWIGIYNATGVVGQDVVKLLNEAISKIPSLNVPVVAILNDTVGVLVRGFLIDRDTGISLILGTGSNACYFEKTNCIPGWTREEKEVALNIEWGPFSDDGRCDIIRTKYDQLVDKESLHPNLFTFEKYVGGEFFGKLVWFVLEDLANQNLIFEGHLSKVLEDKSCFKSAHISEIERDNLQNSIENTKRILEKELAVAWCSEDDIITLKYICELVSLRMALLASMALSVIIKRMNKSHVTIACDGSLYKYHPRLHNYIMDFTLFLIGYKTEVKLIPAEDGSGVGAALIAALACKKKKD